MSKPMVHSSSRGRIAELLLLALCLMICGCGFDPGGGYEIRYRLPQGISGPIIFVQREQGQKVAKVNGNFIVTIPEDGMVELDSFDLFAKPHRNVFVDTLGNEISQIPENRYEPTMGEAVVGYNVGTYSTQGYTYFVYWVVRADEPPSKDGAYEDALDRIQARFNNE